MVTLTIMLVVADGIPRLLAGTPSGVVHAIDIDDAQRRLKAHLFLPPYFPDTYAWPPAQVELKLTTPAAAAFSFTTRRGKSEELRLVEGLDPAAPLDPDLWAPATQVSVATQTEISGRDVPVWRVLLADGTFWHEVVFETKGRRFGLRSSGSIEDLLRMARSMELAR
jgi:hypothetical protein